MKDKTFYIPIDGQMVRLRARKPPDKEMLEALTELVKKVKSMPSKPGKQSPSQSNELPSEL